MPGPKSGAEEAKDAKEKSKKKEPGPKTGAVAALGDEDWERLLRYAPTEALEAVLADRCSLSKFIQVMLYTRE